MKLKKISLAFILGGLVMITGCQNKASLRAEIEGKFTKLSEVYPTENLEELMNKFPDKEIKILHFETRKESDGRFYRNNLSLIAREHKIIGTLEFVDTTERPEKKLDEYKVVYNKNIKKLEREDGKKLDPQVENIKFLFQMLDIKNNPLNSWSNEMVRKIENNGSYSLTYNIKNKELADYLQIDDNIRISIESDNRGFRQGKVGSIHLTGKNGGNSLLESIFIEAKEEK